MGKGAEDSENEYGKSLCTYFRKLWPWVFCYRVVVTKSSSHATTSSVEVKEGHTFDGFESRFHLTTVSLGGNPGRLTRVQFTDISWELPPPPQRVG